MKSERGAVGCLIKRVMKYRLWKNLVFKEQNRASLVAQWLRVCLPMQGTLV